MTTNRILSVHEVYFLVRTGTWSEEDMNTWLQANIEASQYDEDDFNEYEKDWEFVDDDEC